MIIDIDGDCVMEKIENEYFVINYSKSLNKIVKEMIRISTKKVPEIFDFFQIKNYIRVTVNLFDDIDEFKCFVSDLRGINKDELPEYCKGTFDCGMINHYIEPNIIREDVLYNTRIHSIFHELVNIIYNEVILNNNYENRVIWLDEGLAMNLSGEFEETSFNDIFDELLSFKEMPNMNEISHGLAFINDKYDGYIASFISVNYLIKTLNHNELLNIIKNKDITYEVGKDVLNNAIMYNNKKKMV